MIAVVDRDTLKNFDDPRYDSILLSRNHCLGDTMNEFKFQILLLPESRVSK